MLGLAGACAFEYGAHVQADTAATRRTVAVVAMPYNGTSPDDASAKFAKKLATALPSARCAARDWATRIDAARVRDPGSEGALAISVPQASRSSARAP